MSAPEPSILLHQSDYPSGSEWRRWDLHVHTPLSQLGSAFSGVSWDDYERELELKAVEDLISVVGVTDYMSIEGYERLYQTKSSGKLKGIDLLIPNIEFRVMPSTSDGKALNLHLLVNPTDHNHVSKIRRALKNLKFVYDSTSYGCERGELIEFARAQRPSLTHDDEAYAFGIQQFKPDRTALKRWLDTEQWLRANCLIGIANGKDGISGLPLDGFAAIRDEVLRWANFVFSGNPNDRQHYLGKKVSTPRDEIIRQYGSLKPCLHGSDAHELATLFKPDKDRFCWIKGDPSFQGLRQVLWEPEARVQIGAVPPGAADRSQIIRRIHVSNGKGWFSQREIELNSGLVAVIGEKGAGKTAVADLVAFAAGVPNDHKSQSSFITKGRLHLQGLKVRLEWANGLMTSATLPDTPHPATRPLIRYLSQDFVERLCSADHAGRELQAAIEEVVFARLDEVQKEGYSSFVELRAARESASNVRREGFRGELATSHKEIERLQIAVRQRETKIASRNEAAKQIEELRKQLPDLTQLADAVVLARLQEKQSLLSEIETQVSSNTRRRRTLETALQVYREAKTGIAAEVAEIQQSLNDAGVPAIVTERMQPRWDEAVEDLLSEQLIKADEMISSLRGNKTDAPEAHTIVAVLSQIAALKEQVSKDEVAKKRLLDLQKQISERTSVMERLGKEVEILDTITLQQLAKKRELRLAAYLKFFSALKEDEVGLKDLYAPLKEAIENVGASMKFDIDVGYQVDFRSWIDKMSGFFDGRRSGADERQKEIERMVEMDLVPAWKTGDIAGIRSAFERFDALIQPDTFLEKFGSQRVSLVELYDWMFSVDHISLNYKIRYAGTELEYLSPGTRGIALLVLYLLMDEDDTRPLVIDQPEGNLDNSSVYKQLVPYIRSAKLRRQIILITHNPNLVVATDAEQVIVATAERPTAQPYPRMRYYLGALEHSAEGAKIGVRQAVCLLLEGGKEAFREREHRYALEP